MKSISVFAQGHFEDIPICQNESKARQAFKKFDFLSSSGQGSLVTEPCTVMEVYTGIPFGGISEGPRKFRLSHENIRRLMRLF